MFVSTKIDKTREDFEDIKYRLDEGFLDSFSIEYIAPESPTFDSNTNARILDEMTELHGWTLASQPMNEHAVMIKELLKRPVDDVIVKQDRQEETKMVDEVIKTEPPVQTEPDPEYLKFKEMLVKEKKEKELKDMRDKILEELKESLKEMKIEQKVQTNPSEKIETKEYSEFKEALTGKVDVKEQFRRAGNFAEKMGMFAGGRPIADKTSILNREYKFGTNGTKLEYKALGITTNQNTDTDYLLSAAELSDVFDPVIYNALNQATVTWNLLAKDDFSNKGNNQVQFTLKIAANTTAAAYTGDAISTGNVTRLKYQTKFKKYAVGVAVSGDMIAAARGGPIGDIFAQEVADSSADLLAVINAALFAEVGVETAAGVLGFEFVADSAGNATMYSLTRSTTNKLSPDSAADTYINGSSTVIALANLRGAIKQAEIEGASLSNLVFITHPTQILLFKGLYDNLQRLVPTSSRFGFEGRPEFDGVPIFSDKDCNTDDWWLIDLETHRVAIWVPPTLEMLGKDADNEKGFIKTYFAVYNRAPRRLVMIYGNATS